VDGKRREVASIREDWLVQDRWWTDEPVDRHFFELLVEPGRVLTIFHDTAPATGSPTATPAPPSAAERHDS
jgi:hypothetical protein